MKFHMGRRRRVGRFRSGADGRGIGARVGRIVFRGGSVLDGERPARSGLTVVVEDNRITSVSDQEPCTRRRGPTG